MTIEIAQHTRLDGLPGGARLVGEAASCTIAGDGWGAEQSGTSSDWLTLHADGSVSVDARLLLATPAGRTLAVSYRGKAAALPATPAPRSTSRRPSRPTIRNCSGSTGSRASERACGTGYGWCTSSTSSYD